MTSKRSKDRKQVFIAAEITFDGVTRKVVVRDVSEMGARVADKTAGYAKIGQKGVFTKDSLQVACTVKWVNDTGYGLAFEKPVDLEKRQNQPGFTPDAPYASLPGVKKLPASKHLFRQI